MAKTKADLLEEVVMCRKLLLEIRMVGHAPVRDMIDEAFAGEKLYEFDELADEVQEVVLAEELKSSTAYERAIDDCRHMKFNRAGKIVRGYDEE